MRTHCVCQFLLLFVICPFAWGTASITVDAGNIIGPVNRLVLGDNQLGYDPVGIFGDTSIDDYSNYGAGLWDPGPRLPVQEVVDLGNARGLTVSRFPGGCGAHTYNWKHAIGPPAERPHWQFGIDEFLYTCKVMDAIPIITVSYFTGAAQDKADLVEYLNSPNDGCNPWAAARAENGHADPYNVVYFEFGNEAFHTADHQGLVDPAEYVANFVETARAMKAVDPSIKVGAVAFNDTPESDWNRTVFAGVKEDADFIIEHTYTVELQYLSGPPPISASDLFKLVLSSPEQAGRKYRTLNAIIQEETGRTDLPLAITEYNASLQGETPAPYRHCLGNALYIGDMIRIHMEPENNILLANFWMFMNEYWGKIKGPVRGEPGIYVRRPTYWPFWLYHNHFGDELVHSEVVSGTYTTPGGHGALPSEAPGLLEDELVSGDLLAGRSWTHNAVAGVQATESDGVITLEFGPDVSQDYSHSTILTPAVTPGATYRLSAEVQFSRDIFGAKVAVLDSRGYQPGYPAAVTGAPYPRKDTWTRQYAYINTLPQTPALRVILMRSLNEGGSVPAEGETIRFRNIEVHEVLRATLPPTPYLAVNASKTAEGAEMYLMVINKNQEDPVTADINVTGFSFDSAQSWVLNGPAIDAVNESLPNNVNVTEGPVQTVQNGFEFTFEPHSMTALKLFSAP